MMRLPKEITEIMRIIEEDGHQVYIVGGSIRDLLLGIQPEDWDLASNAPPERVEELFGNGGSGTPIDDKSGSGAGVAREDGSKDSAGRKFGVVKVKRGDLTAEVAAFRIDGNYSDHRRPDEVIFTDNIEEDLARRDFTINGNAYHRLK